MKMPITIEMNIEDIKLFARSVCAFSEALGMQAENHMRHVRGDAPSYGEEDFFHLEHKWDLTSHEADDLLSESEKEFFQMRLQGQDATKAAQAAQCESL